VRAVGPSKWLPKKGARANPIQQVVFSVVCSEGPVQDFLEVIMRTQLPRQQHDNKSSYQQPSSYIFGGSKVPPRSFYIRPFFSAPSRHTRCTQGGVGGISSSQAMGDFKPKPDVADGKVDFQPTQKKNMRCKGLL